MQIDPRGAGGPAGHGCRARQRGRAGVFVASAALVFSWVLPAAAREPAPFVPNDSFYQLSRAGLESMAVPQAWRVTQGDPRVVIAVVDSGSRPRSGSHAEPAARLQCDRRQRRHDGRERPRQRAGGADRLRPRQRPRDSRHLRQVPHPAGEGVRSGRARRRRDDRPRDPLGLGARRPRDQPVLCARAGVSSVCVAERCAHGRRRPRHHRRRRRREQRQCRSGREPARRDEPAGDPRRLDRHREPHARRELEPRRLGRRRGLGRAVVQGTGLGADRRHLGCRRSRVGDQRPAPLLQPRTHPGAHQGHPRAHVDALWRRGRLRRRGERLPRRSLQRVSRAGRRRARGGQQADGAHPWRRHREQAADRWLVRGRHGRDAPGEAASRLALRLLERPLRRQAADCRIAVTRPATVTAVFSR